MSFSNSSSWVSRFTHIAARVAIGAAAIGFAIGARGAPPPSGEPPPGAESRVTVRTPPGAPEPTFDARSVARRARLAYRAAGAGFEAAGPTYRVRVQDGAVEIASSPERAVSAAPAPLRLETGFVGRDTPLPLTAPAPRVEDDGSLALDRGAVVEHLHNQDAGLEQTWAFAARPPGEGDLVVRVRASGLPFAGETAGGQHFASVDGTPGLRYGQATWVDAGGARTPLRTRHEAGELVLTVPAAAVDRSSYPAFLDPVVSSEITFDQPAIGIADAIQSEPDIAWNGTHFLVVWSDGRASLGALKDDVYAARVTPAGQVLDPTGILIAHVANGPEAPEVASNGADFFVVWHGYPEPVGNELRGARVGADGTLLDPGGILLGEATSFEPSVTFDGLNYIAVWTRLDSGNLNLHGARVTSTGVLLDPDGFVISNAPGEQKSPQIVSAGGESFVAWLDERNGVFEIYGARIGQNGVVLDPLGLFIGAADLGFKGDKRLGPAVGTNGSAFLVAWVDPATGKKPAAVRVGLDGTILDAAPIQLFTSSAEADSRLAVASDGDAFLVAWCYLSGIRIRRVDSTGALLETATLPDNADDPEYPAAAFGGGTYLVVRSSNVGFTARPMLGSLVSAAGSVAPQTFPVGTMLSSQLGPSGVHTGSSYLVLWGDTRGYVSGGSQRDIYGIRVSPLGLPLEPAAFPVAATAVSETLPLAASNGDITLITWNKGPTVSSGVSVARMAADGALLDPGGISLSATGFPIGVASDGSSFLVLWGQGNQRNGTRVDAAGNVLDPVALTLPVYSQKVVFDGANYLLTGGSPLVGGRLSPGGDLLDPAGLPLSVYKNEAVASSGENSLLVWTTASSVLAGRVGQDGTALDVIPLTLGTTSGLVNNVRVAFDGLGYLAVWTQSDQGQGTRNVLGTRVSTSGQVMGEKGFLIEGPSGIPFTTGVIGGQGGQSLVLYSRFDQAVNSRRLGGRLVSVNGGDGCATGADCDTGLCVDGVCCNSACGGGDPADCSACSVAAGGLVDGVCTVIPDGAACDDGDACTQADACSSGQCTATPLECTPAACHEATCDPATGSCVEAPLPDGAACDGGTCQSGACSGEGGAGAGGGGTGGAGPGGGSPGGGGTGGGGGDEDSGCGCSVPGRSPVAGGLTALLLAIPLLSLRRRRRRSRAHRCRPDGQC